MLSKYEGVTQKPCVCYLRLFKSPRNLALKSFVQYFMIAFCITQLFLIYFFKQFIIFSRLFCCWQWQEGLLVLRPHCSQQRQQQLLTNWFKTSFDRSDQVKIKKHINNVHKIQICFGNVDSLSLFCKTNSKLWGKMKISLCSYLFRIFVSCKTKHSLDTK